MNRDLLGFNPKPSDFIIMVMGLTGSGKTNFINCLTGNIEKANASGLKSATQSVVPYCIQHNGRRIVLVDTPGFDNTHRSDMEILRVIADWLLKKYSSGHGTLRVAGMIYLHPITKHMSGSLYRSFQIFGRLCGNVPLHRARLVTTMWDTLKHTDRQDSYKLAQNRENELVGEFWKPLITEGAEARRFDNTPGSAIKIVDELIDVDIQRGHGADELLLQEELDGQHKRLNETEAGKVLYSRFQTLLANQRSKLKELADEAKLADDPSLASSLQEECDRINAMLQQTFEDVKAMKIPFSRRIIPWFSEGKSRGKGIKLDERSV